MLNLLLFLAAQAAKPEKPLDPKDARSVLAHAVAHTRAQGSYETAFRSRLKFPGSDEFKRQGACLWISPGLLSLHYTGSGGQERNVLRAGDDVWVFERAGDINEWATAAEAMKEGAGRGLENPDEVLAILSKHADKAKFDDKGAVALTFSGEDLARIVKDGTIDPARSSVTVTLETDPENRLKKLALEAGLQPADPAKAAGRLEATLEVTGYNRGAPLRAVDAEGKELPFTGPMRQAIDAVRAKR